MLLGFAAQIVNGSIRVCYNGNWKHEMVGLFQWLLSASSRRRSVLALRYPSGFAVIVWAEVCLIGAWLLSHLVLFAAQSGALVIQRVVGGMG